VRFGATGVRSIRRLAAQRHATFGAGAAHRRSARATLFCFGADGSTRPALDRARRHRIGAIVPEVEAAPSLRSSSVVERSGAPAACGIVSGVLGRAASRRPLDVMLRSCREIRAHHCALPAIGARRPRSRRRSRGASRGRRGRDGAIRDRFARALEHLRGALRIAAPEQDLPTL
jgi:hypothetical protein